MNIFQQMEELLLNYKKKQMIKDLWTLKGKINVFFGLLQMSDFVKLLK